MRDAPGRHYRPEQLRRHVQVNRMIDKIHDARVKKEYEAIKGFYVHFLVYVGVCLLLVLIDVFFGEPMWSHWVVLGWGIGIAFHAYAAFIKTPQVMAAWEAEQMARYAKKKAQS